MSGKSTMYGKTMYWQTYIADITFVLKLYIEQILLFIIDLLDYIKPRERCYVAM